jgi:hypothetical protein
MPGLALDFRVAPPHPLGEMARSRWQNSVGDPSLAQLSLVIVGIPPASDIDCFLIVPRGIEPFVACVIYARSFEESSGISDRV